MTRSTRWIYFGLIALIFAQPVLAKSHKLNQENIAQVASQPLVTSEAAVHFTIGDVYTRISQSRMMLDGGMLNAAEAKRVIDSIVIDSLIILEAQKVDLAKYPLNNREYLHQVHDSLVQAVVNIQIQSKVQADSLEVLRFFHNNPDLFAAEEQVLVWHILISPKGLRALADSTYTKTRSSEQMAFDAREMAWGIWQTLNYGESFKNMAYLFSHDVLSSKESGYVGWTPRGKYLDPFDSVAFSTKVGTYSRPYEDQDGWHIVLIDGYIPTGSLPIDSPYVYNMARSSLMTLRSNQRGERFVDSLYKASTIVHNPAILESNLDTVDDNQWVTVINGQDTMYAWEMKPFEQGVRLKNRLANSTPDLKLGMLQQMVQRPLMVRAAKNLGLTELPTVARFEQEVRLRTTQDIVRRRGQDFLWTPSDSAIERAYREETKSIDVSRPISLQEVIVKDSMFAIFLKDQANSGVPFEDFKKREFLDAVNPDAKVKVSGIKKVGEKDVSPEYWRAVLGIASGRISSVFKVKNGFCLVKVHGRIEAKNVLSSRGNIRVRLETEHRRKVWQNFRDDLYKTYGVRFVNTIESLALKPYRVRNANQATIQ